MLLGFLYILALVKYSQLSNANFYSVNAKTDHNVLAWSISVKEPLTRFCS
jgi:hypothetical protein